MDTQTAEAARQQRMRDAAERQRQRAVDAKNKKQEKAHKETLAGRPGSKNLDSRPYNDHHYDSPAGQKSPKHWINPHASPFSGVSHPLTVGEAKLSKKKKKDSGVQFWDYSGAPYNSSSINNESTQLDKAKKKFKKPNLADKQIMGMNATFGSKSADDDSKDAGMAQNPYESRYVIPAEREPMERPDGVEVGYDKTVEPQDRMKQLKRRKALKLVTAFVEDGVWGGGGGAPGGWAALPPAGTTNTSQAGGTNYTLLKGSPEDTKNYKLKGKNMKSLRDFKNEMPVGEEKKEEPPFEGGKPLQKVHTDKYGNVINPENRARHLARTAIPPVKEEVIGEATVSKHMHSWGKMITVHDGSHQSFPLHPEHQEKIKNLKNGEKTTFTDETNAKIHAHREGDTIHLKHADTKASGRVVSIPYHHFTEEVEQVEEGGMEFVGNSGKTMTDTDIGGADTQAAAVPEKPKLTGKAKKVHEMIVRDAAGKKHTIKNQPIRMASGKIEMHPPGKSGSSGH